MILFDAHAKVPAEFIVDKTAGLTTIEARRGDDEVGHVEREETVAIETARIALRQHEGLGDYTVGIDMAEIGPCEEAVVAAGAEDEPARVGAPVVERLRIVGVRRRHGAGNACSQVEQPEVGLMMPDAELSIVGECVAEEAAVVGGTGEGDGKSLPPPPSKGRGRDGVDDGVDTVAEGAGGGIEVDAAEVVTNRIELMTSLRKSAGCTEIERTAVGRENGIGFVDGVLLEQGRQYQFVFLNVVDLQVGGFVKDLDAVMVCTVEQLFRGVGRIGDIAARRMPIRIDTKAERLVGLGVIGDKR